MCERHQHLHLHPPVVERCRAVLSGLALRDGHRMSVVYRLHSADGTHWLVYDVEVSGRIAGFYTEFDRIILNDGYDDLLSRFAAEVEAARRARRPS